MRIIGSATFNNLANKYFEVSCLPHFPRVVAIMWMLHNYDCYNKITWLNIVNKSEEGHPLVINSKENRKICKASALTLIQ